MQHIPVLLNEALNILDPQPGDTVLDVTLGLAGHAKEFCNRITESGTLIGLDADSENVELAKRGLANVTCKTQCIHTNFIDIQTLDLPSIDILFADLGVSSLHFDVPERGFSHRFEGSLDLRLNRTDGEPFYKVLPGLTKEDIYTILTEYGELDRPHKFSQTLFDARKSLRTTTDLKCVIDEVYTFKAKHFYAKVFQAFRVYVNQELTALKTLLDFAIKAQVKNIGIISFHSLEDRIVKQAFKAATTSTKDEYTGKSLDDALYIPLTKKPIVPATEELHLNPRSRSAKFRAVALKDHARS